MLLIDYREGGGKGIRKESEEMKQAIRRRGVEAEIASLEYGDYQFEGNGPYGKTLVGFERKKVKDLLSCMTDDRFVGHQLPGLNKEYDYWWLWLEGIYQENQQTGMLQEPSGDTGGGSGGGGGVHWRDIRVGNTYYYFRQLDNFLNSLDVQFGVRVKYSRSMRHTVSTIVNAYNYWQKEWSDHRTGKVIYTPRAPVTGFITEPKSLCRTFAAQIPGVGWEKSALVEQAFGKSARTMCNAGADRWIEIKPGFGKVLANRIPKQLRGEE